MAHPTPACHKVAVSQGIVGPGIKSRTALPTKAVPHCEISRIWLESEMRPPPPLTHLALHPHLIGTWSHAIRSMLQPRVDAVRKLKQDVVVRSNLSYEGVYSTRLVVISLQWNFIFCGVSEQNHKTSYDTASLHKFTSYFVWKKNILQPVRWYFLLETPCRDKLPRRRVLRVDLRVQWCPMGLITLKTDTKPD